MNNYLEFQQYLTGKDQIQRIEEAGKKTDEITRPTIRNPYFSKRQVFWISLTSPIRIILSVACKAIAYVLNTI
jgi:hypothetical protein